MENTELTRAAEAAAKTKGIGHDIALKKHESIEAIGALEKASLQEISQAKDAAAADMQAAIEDIKSSKEGAATLVQKIEGLSGEAEKLKDDLSTKSTSGDELLQQITADKEEINAQLVESTAANEELKKVHAEATETNNKITELEKGTSETRAKFDGHIEHIADTHGAINKEKAAMVAFRNEYEENLGKFKDETNTLLNKNKAIQKEVESHLQKAVGVSLFKAFDERRKVVDQKANRWLVALLIAIVAELICIAVLSLTVNDLGAGFAIRTLLAFLIGWVAIYSGSQYKLERRAEEEYAFKSNISLSLKPFQDLLEDFKANGGDVTSLEKRLDEVFDNPCFRLFKSSGKSQGNTVDISWLQKIVEKKIEK